jgi:hypothetical protein
MHTFGQHFKLPVQSNKKTRVFYIDSMHDCCLPSQKNENRRLGKFKDTEFAFQTSWSIDEGKQSCIFRHRM